MLSYSQIFKQSFHITFKYPVLWIFGLFAAGGFNFNFLKSKEFGNITIREHIRVPEIFAYLQIHPGVLAVLSAGILLISVGGLLITNWSRVMLILSVNSVIEKKNVLLSEQIKKSKLVLYPALKMSLITSGLIIFVAAGLLLPTTLFVRDLAAKQTLFVLGGLIFLLLVYTVSYINIFTTFFIVLFKKSAWQALNLGADFFISRWSPILALSLVTSVIYIVGFVGGISIMFMVRVILYFFGSFLLRFGIFEFSAIILLIRLLFSLLLWLWLAGLSVFFNSVWLQFFTQYILPISAEEKKIKTVVAPISLTA